MLGWVLRVLFGYLVSVGCTCGHVVYFYRRFAAVCFSFCLLYGVG